MPIEYKRNKAIFHDTVIVDEAESLLEWLQKNPTGKVDLAGCSHLHTACLQVLMASHSRIISFPSTSFFSTCIEAVLHTK